METVTEARPDLATERLAGELADVKASIELVSSGVASRITLTGLRFGQQVTERMSAAAARRGIDLEASFWPEETVCDIRVSRTADATNG